MTREWAGSSEDEPFNHRSAAKVTGEWIDNRIPKTAGVRHSQTHRLMVELGAQCVAETLRLGEGEDELCMRLDKAWDIVFGIWHITALAFATKFYFGDDKPTPDEEERREAARHVVWTRRDPLVAYREGLDSDCQIRFAPDDFAFTVAEYLERPWLRHPALDWIMVDMTVSRELCAFGEELKQKWLPGPKDFLGIHAKYLDVNGDLAKMQKFDWNAAFERWNAVFWGALAFPIGAIWAAFHFGYNTIGMIVAGLYALFIVLVVVSWMIRLLIKIARAIRGAPDPSRRPFELWQEMYEVWRRLEGPVINPTRVRDAMTETAAKGAVWDSATWSIVDRVIAVDPAVWIPNKSTTP